MTDSKHSRDQFLFERRHVVPDLIQSLSSGQVVGLLLAPLDPLVVGFRAGLTFDDVLPPVPAFDARKPTEAARVLVLFVQFKPVLFAKLVQLANSVDVLTGIFRIDLDDSVETFSARVDHKLDWQIQFLVHGVLLLNAFHVRLDQAVFKARYVLIVFAFAVEWIESHVSTCGLVWRTDRPLYGSFAEFLDNVSGSPSVVGLQRFPFAVLFEELNAVAYELVRSEQRCEIFEHVAFWVVVFRYVRYFPLCDESPVFYDQFIQKQVVDVVVLFFLRRSVSVFESDVVQCAACYVVPVK